VEKIVEGSNVAFLGGQLLWDQSSMPCFKMVLDWI